MSAIGLVQDRSASIASIKAAAAIVDRAKLRPRPDAHHRVDTHCPRHAYAESLKRR